MRRREPRDAGGLVMRLDDGQLERDRYLWNEDGGMNGTI